MQELLLDAHVLPPVPLWLDFAVSGDLGSDVTRAEGRTEIETRLGPGMARSIQAISGSVHPQIEIGTTFQCRPRESRTDDVVSFGGKAFRKVSTSLDKGVETAAQSFVWTRPPK